ncbi:MAG: hypothetical protein ACKN9A_20845 [Microcystis aeruginosa]
MLETLLSSILLTQSDYFHLTPTNKVAVERRIAEKSFGSDPQINPREISSILNLKPQCGANPANSQIQCTWKEGNRHIKAYWLKPWRFQRWESRGF